MFRILNYKDERERKERVKKEETKFLIYYKNIKKMKREMKFLINY